MKFDYILKYTGHTAEWDIVNGLGRFEIFKGSVDQNGDFTPEGLRAAKDDFETRASNRFNKTVYCDTITLTAMREDGKVVLEFPYGLGKPMYDSKWSNPRYIGAVKPFPGGFPLPDGGEEG